jgi:DNA-directed RNA polymerase beta' subunit
MFDAAVWGDRDPMKGVSANIMFGQKPPCGTGFVDILVDETRLPEGPEQDVKDDTLEKVNERLDKLEAVPGVTLEAVRMDW